MFDILDKNIILTIASYLNNEDILDLSLCCNYLYRLLYDKELHLNCIKEKQKRNKLRREVHNIICRVKDTLVLKGTCSICQTNGLLFKKKTNIYGVQQNDCHFVCIDYCSFQCLFCGQKIQISSLEGPSVEPVLCTNCIAYYG